MTIVITGASRGIGATLAAQYKGAGEEVIGTARGAGAGAVLDVTDPASHAAFAASLADRPLDLLICNAGVYLDKGDDLDAGFGPDLWAQSFATNVTGVFLTVQSLLPNLRAAKSAKIAIIASQMGSQTRAPGGQLYLPRLQGGGDQSGAQFGGGPKARGHRGGDLPPRLGAHGYGR